MPIETEMDLEQALEEFHLLAEAAGDTPDGERRRALEGEIEAWFARHPGTMRPAKPEGSIV